MIKGMTGFGSSFFSSGNLKGSLEIKTVNHRYFDIVFYLPPGFAATEDKIRQFVGKEVERGRITVSVKITAKPQISLAFANIPTAFLNISGSKVESRLKK